MESLTVNRDKERWTERRKWGRGAGGGGGGGRTDKQRSVFFRSQPTTYVILEIISGIRFGD